ncbi:MAG: MFS transporter [Candidatus Bathyarchaeota archaeon]
MSNSLTRIKDFFGRQTANFKVLLVTAISNTSAKSLTAGQAAQTGGGATSGASYLQLYLRALGADPQQLGFLNSLTQLANALFGLPIGWISDKFSLKKVVVAGLILAVFVPIIFAVSPTWTFAMPAMMLNAVASTLVGMFLNIFFITSIRHSSDRAKAMSMKSILIAVVGLIVPSISALIVLNFGGIGVDGIRPLFIIDIVASILILFFAALKLKEVAFLQKKGAEQGDRSFLKNYVEIAKIPSVQKWTITKCLRTFFGNGLLPFYSIFYVTVKGANEITIAAMGTIATLGAIIFLIPFGRLADKYGRKKIIYLTRPFNYLSVIIVILAPSPEYLILAAFLGALNTVSFLMEITMEHELVPEHQRGRLGGFLSFFMGLTGIPGSILAGYLWGFVNPGYLLLIPILADLPFMAMLSTISDTLHIDYTEKPSPS